MANDSNDLVKLRLTVDVHYHANGTSITKLENMLKGIADHAANRGLMTEETPAEVETWYAHVEDIGEHQ